MTSIDGSTVFTPDSSTIANGVYTPGTTAKTPPIDIWDGRRRTAVPMPGHTYQIFLQDTNKAILMTDDGGAYLGHMDSDWTKHGTWLCGEKNGYFGFTQLGRYLGHTMTGHIHAWASNFDNWEFFTVNKNEEGGYKQLMPHWSYSLETIYADGDGPKLLLRDYGTESWEFVKVG
ncbi:hypothetical protein ACHAQJ_007051 [Trichoderma viride]